MAEKSPATCEACLTGSLRGGKGMETFRGGLWTNNPISIQILGICSALAVTNRLENSLVMGAAVTFVCIASNLFLSLLRNATPRRIRMIAEMAVIATFVIVIDQLLRGFYWDVSRRLGPYVGLIVTNCILMGRAEAFALQNPPLLSMVDGAANGLGYAAVLAIIGFFRELIGSGEIFGKPVLLSEWYTPNQLMIVAPGAFFALGFLIAAFNAVKGRPQEEKR